jgi:hypothetical protein
MKHTGSHDCDYDACGLVFCTALQSGDSLTLPSPYVRYLLASLFDPEDGGDMFLRIGGTLSTLRHYYLHLSIYIPVFSPFFLSFILSLFLSYILSYLIPSPYLHIPPIENRYKVLNNITGNEKGVYIMILMSVTK